jgi:hypothetical protein
MVLLGGTSGKGAKGFVEKALNSKRGPEENPAFIALVRRPICASVAALTWVRITSPSARSTLATTFRSCPTPE